MLQNNQFDLQIIPGSIPPVLHMSQYDSGRQFTAILKNGSASYSVASGATAKIKGFNAAGVAWEQEATISGSTVIFTPSGAATDQFGVMPVTIEITKGEEVLTPLLVVFDIQRAGYTNEEAVRSPEFETALEAAIAAAMAHYEPLIVKITGSTSYSIDKTYAEITNAVVANRPIWAEWNGYRLQFVGIDNGALFQYVDTSTTTTVLVEFFISTTGVTSKNPRNI